MLARNLERIRKALAAAAARSGRAPEEIRMVAVTKGVGPDSVRELLRLGVKEFGENRLQEAQPKIEVLAPQVAAAGARWHMIGHLQTNKARAALRHFSCVDAVDSTHLAEALVREARRAGRTGVPCLVEVNVSGEERKHGLAVGELEVFLRQAAAWPELDLRGLFALAPFTKDPDRVARPVFRALRELRDAANAGGWSAHPLTELSMGMSGDFEVAVEEGATQVRLGTALFAGEPEGSQ